MFIYTIGTLTYYHRNNEFYKGLKWRTDLSEWAENNNIKVFNPALNFIGESPRILPLL